MFAVLLLCHWFLHSTNVCMVLVHVVRRLQMKVWWYHMGANTSTPDPVACGWNRMIYCHTCQNRSSFSFCVRIQVNLSRCWPVFCMTKQISECCCLHYTTWTCLCCVMCFSGRWVNCLQYGGGRGGYVFLFTPPGTRASEPSPLPLQKQVHNLSLQIVMPGPVLELKHLSLLTRAHPSTSFYTRCLHLVWTGAI